MTTVAGKKVPNLPGVPIMLMPGDLIRRTARITRSCGSSYLM